MIAGSRDEYDDEPSTIGIHCAQQGLDFLTLKVHFRFFILMRTSCSLMCILVFLSLPYLLIRILNCQEEGYQCSEFYRKCDTSVIVGFAMELQFYSHFTNVNGIKNISLLLMPFNCCRLNIEKLHKPIMQQTQDNKYQMSRDDMLLYVLGETSGCF